MEAVKTTVDLEKLVVIVDKKSKDYQVAWGETLVALGFINEGKKYDRRKKQYSVFSIHNREFTCRTTNSTDEFLIINLTDVTDLNLR